MIKQEIYIDESGVEYENLIHTFSDSGKVIMQLETGIEYDEAIDCFPLRYTYVETDKDVYKKNEIVEETENNYE